MKKFLTILTTALLSIVCVFSAVGCNNSNAETLYVYTNAGFAPYEYVDKDGAVKGVDIEIMQEIAEVLGYKIVINDIEFDQILEEVGKNTMAVGAAGMTKNDERDKIALASISYATSVQYVITLKDALDDKLVGGKLPISALADLDKKAIGVQEGTTGNWLIDDAINGVEDDDGAHVEGELEGKGNSVITYTNAIVASGDIGKSLGAVVIDKLPAESIVASNNALECYEIDAEPESYVLYFNLGATALVEEVNKVLKSMIDNGVINYYTLKHSGGIVG